MGVRFAPLVTAIIPAYNAQNHLGDAIRSVLDQTYRNTECLVIDDGSTDRTADVVAMFGRAVRYIRKPNGGVASARNRGVAEAVGSLVAFLDADDVWVPEKLELQVALLGRRPDVGLIYSGLFVVDERLRRVRELVTHSPEEAVQNALLLQSSTLTSQTAVMPIDVFRDVGGFDERLSTSADTDLACRIALRYPIDRIGKPLLLYRQHGGQMHLDVRAMEHDMLLIYEKIFRDRDLAPAIARLRSRCYATLYAILAATSLRRSDHLRAGRYLSKSLRHNPLPAGRLLVRSMKRGVEQGSSDRGHLRTTR